MKKSFGTILISVLFIFQNNAVTAQEETPIFDTTNQHLLMSVVWYQNSAEMKALYYQSFNIAKMMVDQHLRTAGDIRKKAVVLDIDETVLDNSPFEADCILTGKSYTSERWKAWTDLVQADSLPGALEFTKYVKSKDVEVFYVSNRKEYEMKATIENLRKFGFPNAEEKYVLLKKDTGSKKARREKISENYNIILLIGDNLGDFDEIFDKRKKNYGMGKVDDHKELFGKRFIILPNPMYGAWEKAIFQEDYSLSPAEKDSLRKESLKRIEK